MEKNYLLDSFWINISPILGLFSPKHNYFVRFEAHSAHNIFLALLNKGNKPQSIGKMRVWGKSEAES